MTSIAEIEELVANSLKAVIAGGLIKTIAGEVWDLISQKSSMDEVAITTLKELRQHCESVTDLITRLIQAVDAVG